MVFGGGGGGGGGRGRILGVMYFVQRKLKSVLQLNYTECIVK
jgi:hypothetical protein